MLQEVNAILKAPDTAYTVTSLRDEKEALIETGGSWLVRVLKRELKQSQTMRIGTQGVPAAV